MKYASVKLCVVGGELQGIEALYLAEKAGFETVLIDRKKNPPALPFAGDFHQLDISIEKKETAKILSQVDAVLPALENINGLDILAQICRSLGILYLQDNHAFRLTNDKLATIEFFERLSIPYPALYPKAVFPLIVKPVSRSGSKAIYKVRNHKELKNAVTRVRRIDSRHMIQEYTSGCFLSLELNGLSGASCPLQITTLEFDQTFGCKRVFVPSKLSGKIKHEIIEIGNKIVKGLKLIGLTDIQIVALDEVVKVVEINARLPSQTPTVVYHSVGLNMVELLYKLFRERRIPKVEFGSEKAVIYQHLQISNSDLKVVGEHSLSRASELRLERDFFGVDEAITNFPLEKEVNEERVATLVIKDKNLSRAKERMAEALCSIVDKYGLSGIVDKSPPGIVE